MRECWEPSHNVHRIDPGYLTRQSSRQIRRPRFLLRGPGRGRGLDLDPLKGTEVAVSAVSFAESDTQGQFGEHCDLVPSIRASCVFELPITKSRAEIEAINANTDLEPLHWLVNFEIAHAWLGHARAMRGQSQS